MGFLKLAYAGAMIAIGITIAGCTALPSPSIEAETGATTTPPPSLPPTPTAAATLAVVELPNPGGTCSSSQLVVAGAQGGFTFSTALTRHAYFIQSVVNRGPTCVLKTPKVIGLAPRDGSYRAISASDIGNEVCANGACRYVTPGSYSIRTGQTFSIEFSVSWWVGGTDENGNQVFSPPPCSGAVHDVVNVEFPLGTGAIFIDLEADGAAGSSIPWHEVCASPTHLFFDVSAT